MPTLACRICGRVVYTTGPIESLFAEERRCPRCGGVIDVERRSGSQRRRGDRRQNPPDVPGPPDGSERRVAERRQQRRRRTDDPSFIDV